MTKFNILYLCVDNNAKSRAGLEALHQAGYNLVVLIYEIPSIRIDPKRPRELYEKPKWNRRECLYNQSSSIYCHEHEIPYMITHETTKLDLHIPILESMEYSYLVVNGWPTKISKQISALPQVEAINCHSSYLPEYRGGNITYATLINREKTSGITAHVLTDKFDAGLIIAQTRFEIDRFETTKNLTYKRSKYIGDVLLKAMKTVGNKEEYITNPPSPFWKRQSYLSYLTYRFVNALRTLFGLKIIRREPTAIRWIDRI